MFRGLLFAVGFAVSGIAPCAAEAGQPASLSELYFGEPEAPAGPLTSAPVGWVDFCQRYRSECDDSDLPAATIVLTPESWKDLRSTNDLVNRMIEPVSDLVHWKVPEKWDYPSDGKGDCEDYVLMKRKLLLQRGYARQALLIAVVYKSDDEEGHAVLMVKTDAGDLILDNRRDNILHWNNTGYEFMKRQSQENQNRWVWLGNPIAAPVAVSAQSNGAE
jgi:predicted transglutaminase-like cysteine proteinase